MPDSAAAPACEPHQPSAPAAATVICTLGMHRSGTSLASRILNLLGVYLGPPQSISNVGYDNPKGYWEHHPIALLNDELLARFGGRWNAPSSFPHGWAQDPALDDLKAKGRALLFEHFATSPIWGWKDPRTCLTLPFWQDLIGPMRYVVCLRNPCEVVASLARRDDISCVEAERLWLLHVQASLTHTAGQPRLFVFYEDLLADLMPQLRRMRAFIGLAEQEVGADARVREFVEPALCHHHMSIEELIADRQMSFASKSLYLALRLHTSVEPGESGVTHGRTGGVTHKTIELLAEHAVSAYDRAVTIDLLAAERQRLQQDNEHHAITFAALHERATALAADVHERATLETHLHGVVATLEGRSQELDADRGRLVTETRRQADTIAVLHLEREQLAARAAQADALVGQEHAWRQLESTLRAQLDSARCEQERLAADLASTTASRARLEADLAGATASRAKLEAGLAGATASRARLESDLADAAASRAKLETDLAGATVRQTTLEADVHRLTVEHGTRAEDLLTTTAELNEIHTSSAWRLVTVGRRLLTTVCPGGTRRRQLVDRIVRRAARRTDVALRS